MKELKIYLQTPIGINNIGKAVDGSTEIRDMLKIDFEPVSYSSTEILDGAIFIKGDRVEVISYPTHSVTISANNVNGIVYGLMGLIGAVDKLNASLTDANHWQVMWSLKDSETETFDFDEFFDKPRNQKYYRLPSIVDIDLDRLIENLI